jgi:hypothetical protein
MNGAESSGVDAVDVSAEEDPIVYGLFFLYSFPGPFSAMLNKPSFQWMANQCRSPRLVRSTTI